MHLGRDWRSFSFVWRSVSERLSVSGQSFRARVPRYYMSHARCLQLMCLCRVVSHGQQRDVVLSRLDSTPCLCWSALSQLRLQRWYVQPTQLKPWRKWWSCGESSLASHFTVNCSWLAASSSCLRCSTTTGHWCGRGSSRS